MIVSDPNPSSRNIQGSSFILECSVNYIHEFESKFIFLSNSKTGIMLALFRIGDFEYSNNGKNICNPRDHSVDL